MEWLPVVSSSCSPSPAPGFPRPPAGYDHTGDEELERERETHTEKISGAKIEEKGRAAGERE